MRCFVCGGEMEPYFVKKIGVKYLRDIDTFEYERCENCGMTISKTLYEMSREDWKEFNNNAFKITLMEYSNMKRLIRNG